MHIIKNPIYILVICLLIFVAIFVYKNEFKLANLTKNMPVAKKIVSNTQLKVFGWIPFWDQEKAVASFTKHVDKFNAISVFWYGLDSNGEIQPYDRTKLDPKIITFAHEHNVKVLALVANLSDGDNWDSNRVDRVISSATVRKQHIRKLVQLVEQNNFDGIDIDYEALQTDQKEDFSLFIEELAMALHAKGKVLGVAIHPKTGEDKPEEDNGSHAQDLARLSKAADQLYFMTYLENGTYSTPGPLGSPEWMQRVMEYALGPGKVDPQKAFLGIGLTGAEWKKDQNGNYVGDHDDITFDETYTLVHKEGLSVQWKDESPYIQKDDWVIWFENASSTGDRLELAKELHVGGVAFWRLGGEDDAMWPLINRFAY